MSNTQNSHLEKQVGEVHGAAESANQPTSQRNINDLPNELLQNIFGYLDTPQPSSTKPLLYDEPTFDITNAEVANLKTVSYISKRWRAAILPLLFRHTRLIIPKIKAEDKGSIRVNSQGFLDFIARPNLCTFVASFTLICYENNIEKDLEKDSNNILSIFWETLFDVINPVDVMIVAPAEALSFFTACEINEAESWNFDVPCQYLRLQRLPVSQIIKHKEIGDPTPGNDKMVESLNLSSDGEMEKAIVAFSSNTAGLFNRPWYRLLLNEGSFIKAHSTYEFWERTPPSILPSLLRESTNLEGLATPSLLSSTIRDLEYIGIFPMESHFSSITRKIPRLDRLYVQIVPRNDILEDSVKMTQVDAQDLWMERNRCYALLMRELFNYPPEGNYRYLKAFESGDAADQEAWEMAVEYMKRANVGWKVAGDGVFVRDEPDAQGQVGDGSAFESSLVSWAWNGTAKLPISAMPLYG